MAAKAVVDTSGSNNNKASQINTTNTARKGTRVSSTTSYIQCEPGRAPSRAMAKNIRDETVTLPRPKNIKCIKNLER